MTAAFFVTGTDTGVGKTTVSVALLAAASRMGLRTAGMKPAETGCERGPGGELVPQDALALQRASSVQHALRDVCPYRFAEPVAPGVAAEREGVTIDFELVRGAYQRLASSGVDWMLVEGAGGLLVPLGGGRSIADLVGHLGLSLLIVARPGLGTINHTLLTIEAARARGIEVAGFIFSRQDPWVSEAAIASNSSQIAQLSRAPYLGCLPHVSDTSPDASAAAAAATLRLASLIPGQPS